MALKQFTITYLMRYTPHRQRERLCVHYTTVKAETKREARRYIKSNVRTVLILNTKEVTEE